MVRDEKQVSRHQGPVRSYCRKHPWTAKYLHRVGSSQEIRQGSGRRHDSNPFSENKYNNGSV